MKIHVQHSLEAETSCAIDEVLLKIDKDLAGAPAELAFLFVTHHHEDHFSTISGQIQNRLECKEIIGCTAGTVISGSNEYEGKPGVVLWVLSQTDYDLQSFHLQFERDEDHVECIGLPELRTSPEREHTAVFLFCEPYSSSPYIALPQLENALGPVPIFGGIADGGIGPGESCLFLNGEKLEHGAVGVVCRTGHRIRPIVSQGCRPIGHTFIVTKTEKNIIYEMGGLPTMQQFRGMFKDLDPEDQELVRQGPQLGVVTNEYKEIFDRGDFLVSNVLGSDPESGAIAVSQPIRAGRTVQFHVRDAQTAREDLRMMVEHDLERNPQTLAGALMFTCNGRGEKLFGNPHHDASALIKGYGDIPIAGIFAQGELGPIGKKNYLHGFTASIALFEE
ncbi:MAG: FIST C-terminal domain-containing protein [Planctomycetaceae bacterium]|nr:FIST C-terminal domain-containing protein [Planctomycetaceae bacterium]